MIFDRLLAKIRCWRGKHTVIRNRVRRDGRYFTGKCADCGARVRKPNGGTWERYDP